MAICHASWLSENVSQEIGGKYGGYVLTYMTFSVQSFPGQLMLMLTVYVRHKNYIILKFC